MVGRTALILLLVMLPVTVLGQGDKPRALALKDLKGRIHRLSDYRGKVVLLNFWATWCPPCRAEMPDLVKWQKDYGRLGLQVLGITYPPTEISEVLEFARSVRINYPILLGEKETRALFDPGETLPITVVIDRNGNVREVIEGILLPEEFEQKIKPLLQ
jgi:thiol-disulfide isomerase/thioredoxin